MSESKSITKLAIQFDNKIDPETGRVVDSQPSVIKWDTTYNQLKLIANEVNPYESGVDYNLGVRTLFGVIKEIWTVRGTLNGKDKIDNYVATIGWNEEGHQKLLKYKAELTKIIGPPVEEKVYHKYEEEFLSGGSFNYWKFDNVTFILSGSEFRDSMWYKISIDKK